MKTKISAIMIWVGSFISSSAWASHVPAIEVLLDGRGARYVSPVLTLEGVDEALPVFQDGARFLWEDAVPGQYLLRLYDKDYGTLILEEPMTVEADGAYHLKGNTRHLQCLLRGGQIECLNYY